MSNRVRTKGRPAILKDLLAANATYAERFASRRLSKRPRRQTVILTCMDARMDPHSFLGLGDGEVHILRNAGGRVTPDVIRSIVISQWLLGTRDVVIIHHTDCGLISTDDSLRLRIESKAKVKIGRIDLRPIADLESSVRDDLAALRRSSIIRQDARIAGLIYDVRSGRLHQVSPADDLRPPTAPRKRSDPL